MFENALGEKSDIKILSYKSFRKKKKWGLTKCKLNIEILPHKKSLINTKNVMYSL